MFAKKYLKENVELIEIEVFSYCNRQCWHCSNSVIDRHSGNTYMSNFIYNKILKNLEQINYNKMISFSRYNEPLADKIIYKRLLEARTRIPNALLSLNTNGDFLDKDVIKKLYDSGLRNLNIQIYMPINSLHEIIESNIIKVLQNLSLDEISRTSNKEKIAVNSNYANMNINIYYRNFCVNGVNRGGIVSKLNKVSNRIAPCLVPTKGIYIDYNGIIMPCCNLRSDWKEHKKFILGNLNDNNQNLFTIFYNKKAKAFRELMASGNLKSYPCNTCLFQREETKCKKSE